jgi:hypothetical protein
MPPTTPDAPVTMRDMMSFFEKMMATIVAEIRKPPVDPVKEAQRARELATKITNEREYWEKRIWKLLNCKHEREDGTCLIGWATQSDNKERGVCPICCETIGPEMAITFPHLADQMKALYQELRKRPRGRKESVRYVA